MDDNGFFVLLPISILFGHRSGTRDVEPKGEGGKERKGREVWTNLNKLLDWVIKRKACHTLYLRFLPID